MGEFNSSSDLRACSFGTSQLVSLLPEEPHLMDNQVSGQFANATASGVKMLIAIRIGLLHYSIVQIGFDTGVYVVNLHIRIAPDDAG